MAGSILLAMTLGAYILATFMDRAERSIYWGIVIFMLIFWFIWFVASCVWLTKWNSATDRNTYNCNGDLWCKMTSVMWNVTIAVLILYFVTLFPSIYFGQKIKKGNFSELNSGGGSNVSK